jgi:opacity protein-like surface antigen
MKRFSPFVVVLSLLFALPLSHSGSKAHAQWAAGVQGEDHVSVALHAGIFSPATDLSDGTSFDSGTSLGLSATYWPLARFGLNGFAFTSETEATASPETAASAFDPSVRGFTIGPIVRYPMASGGLALAPYASAGVGAKQYNWAIKVPRRSNTALAWSLGGGVDIRPASSPQYGLQIEARNLRSNYQWHGFQPDPEAVNDLILTVGLALNR